MTLRAITADKAQLFIDRIEAESLNAGHPFKFTLEAVLSSIGAGDVLLLDIDPPLGAQDFRVAIWLHREPDDPTTVYLPHFWCPSTRVLELFGKVCNLLISRGIVTAKFDAAMPVGARAQVVTGATVGPDGYYTIALSVARQRLTALGVP